MKKIIITGMNEDRVIGKNGELPWHYPEDMRHFKDTTTGYPVLMGRKTYESLPENYKPLPNRTNIVLTRNPEKLESKEDIEVAESIENAWKIAEKTEAGKAFVIGGENVYKQTLENVDQLIISRIPEKVDNADAFFPTFDKNKWSKLESRELSKIEVEIWERN